MYVSSTSTPVIYRYVLCEASCHVCTVHTGTCIRVVHTYIHVLQVLIYLFIDLQVNSESRRTCMYVCMYVLQYY